MDSIQNQQKEIFVIGYEWKPNIESGRNASEEIYYIENHVLLFMR